MYPMNLSFHSVVLFVSDITRSKDFYTTILNQEVEFDFGKNIVFKNGLSLWEIREDHPIAATGEHGETGKKKAFEMYFETDDLDSIQAEIARHKLDFLHDMLEEPWGQRTVRFYDPDNNLIEVGESMHAWVCRMRNEGFSQQEITERTTIPVEIIRKILDEQ
jgi:catechol 2,3-dioxygenase-like lactoylglutathione lyase family enzyme